MSSTGLGILQWPQQEEGLVCGTVFHVFNNQREQVEDQAKEWGLCLWPELLCLDCCVLLLLPRFYGALLGSVCVLYLLPLCWVLAILNSTLFLGNTQFYQGKRPPWK